MASKPRSQRAVARTAHLAKAAGLAVIATSDDHVDAEGPGGTVQIPVLSFPGPTPAGDRAAIARLTDRIAASLGEWRFAMHLEAPLPAGVDPEPIGRAALLWRMALDKGEKRRHARYADDGVKIDLSVTQRTEQGGACVQLGPIGTSDRLVDVYRRARRACGDCDGDVVLALHADPAWALSRHYVLDMLYGTPECVVVDEDRWRGAFRLNPNALFVAESRLVSVWFVAGGDDADFHTTAFDNPWHARTIALPGTRVVREEPAFAGKLLRRVPTGLGAISFASLAPTPWSTP